MRLTLMDRGTDAVHGDSYGWWKDSGVFPRFPDLGPNRRGSVSETSPAIHAIDRGKIGIELVITPWRA